ncbi:MAG TPA: alpha/beta fold hydrolase [Pseudonocardiaceae bacterium]
MARSWIRRAAATVLVTAGLVAGSAAVTTGTAAAVTPDPVIIVNGTGGPAFYYEPLRARLQAAGYRAWIFQLTNLGLGDIRGTSRDLAAFVASVRAQTGAAKVDLVGHSQGGLVARQYVKYDGGASTVDSLVMFGTPNHGTLAANLARLFTAGTCVGIVACQQMTVGSAFLAELNAGDDTIGGVRYTSFYTVYDEVVFPYTTSALDDGATNVRIQSQCPLRYLEHVAGIHDGTLFSGIADALAGRSITLDCFAW